MPAPLYGSPSPYPDSPAAFSPLTISNSDRKTEDRTLSTDIKTYFAPLFESGDFSLFQKQKSDKLSVAAEKVLSLFLFVAFEIIRDSAGWMKGENTVVYRRQDAPFGERPRRFWATLEQNLVKQKSWVQALGFSMELSERNASFH